MKDPIDRQPLQSSLQQVHSALMEAADATLKADLLELRKDIELYLVGLNCFHDDHIVLAVPCPQAEALEKALRALGDIYIRIQYQGGDYVYITWYA